MRRLTFSLGRRCIGLVLILVLIGIVLYATSPATGRPSSTSSSTVLAQGAGRTLVEGGTGAAGVGSYPPFTPVLTVLGFHAEKSGNTVAGSLDCTAMAPESGASFTSQSAQFTVNAMYVTGQVTGGSVQGNTATLTGTANVTGLGAASNTPFTFIVKGGGPGATAVLAVSGLVFNEVLLDGGSFQVGSN